MSLAATYRIITPVSTKTPSPGLKKFNLTKITNHLL